MINHKEIAKQARNLGKIARMNHLNRVPLRDEKLTELIGEMTTAEMFLHMKEWCHGFDEQALEYARLQLEINQKTIYDN